MNITYDNITNTAYIKITKAKIEKSVPIGDCLIFDMAKDNRVVGVEILDASSCLAI